MRGPRRAEARPGRAAALAYRALELDAFMSRKQCKDLAAALNTRLTSSTFACWRQGVTLDVGECMQNESRRAQATIVSVAHLDDKERALVLDVLLEEGLSWVRELAGSQRLRGLVVFDEATRSMGSCHPTRAIRRDVLQ